jgi:ribonuclease E
MSSNKMLIDATHPEETRVVVLRGGRVEEFDFESAARKLLRGNIFLAKITRVEPSLQAAFVDYGGNRHGFLAFNEIHPDYYQIPVADRQALIDEEAAAEAEDEAAADRQAEERSQTHGDREEDHPDGEGPEEVGVDVTAFLPPEPEAPSEPQEAAPSAETAGPPEEEAGSRTITEAVQPEERLTEAVPSGTAENGHVAEHSEPREDDSGARADASGAHEPRSDENGSDASEEALSDAPKPIGLVEEVGVEEVEENGNGNGGVEQVDNVVAEDALEELPSRPRRRQRSYKIQEVIKRRQIVLVQVVKEERGSKGAALTTYLSLAGRYTVLMPNTARGGGISRKITNVQDRKRLKAIAAELDVPEGMGLIIRTAGASRTKQEIKRDFEYLLRLWESVRELTLRSTAPALVYEEGDLIKRSIRDLYTKDIDEIIVAGEAAYKEARDFMRMLMPSHVKNVVLYQDPEPLFSRYQIERQLNAMFSPYVHLKSGGYLVINQTEALVAIDVNSGKATREFSIEETALNTNLEAADEIARQLKLRDLAGLIVIDFIDMEEKRNNRAVERRLKEALRFDRARIQVGRISHFGLLEMSRQRLRTGVLEGSTSQCPHCQGTGIIRSTESVALAVLRAMEDALMSGPPAPIVAKTTASVALYILNNKRSFINEMESRYKVPIYVQASDKAQGANFFIEKAARSADAQRQPERSAVSMDWGFEGEEEPEPAAREEEVSHHEAEDGEGARRSRRRRRRRGRRSERGESLGVTAVPGNGADEEIAYSSEGADTEDDVGAAEAAEDEAGAEVGAAAVEEEGEAHEDRRNRRGRRRGRRGGRRDRGEGSRPGAEAAEAAGEVEPDEAEREAAEPELGLPVAEPVAERAPAAAVAAQPLATESAETVAEAAPQPPAAAAEAASEEPAPTSPVEEPEAQPLAAAAEPASAEDQIPELQAGEARLGRNARTEPVASEPVIERIVVGPEIGTAEQPAPAEPVRRGWWQRRFGATTE